MLVYRNKKLHKFPAQTKNNLKCWEEVHGNWCSRSRAPDREMIKLEERLQDKMAVWNFKSYFISDYFLLIVEFYFQPIVIDASGHLTGRLAALVAKTLLAGQRVIVLRLVFGNFCTS